jgi:hypothetical protein
MVRWSLSGVWIRTVPRNRADDCGTTYHEWKEVLTWIRLCPRFFTEFNLVYVSFSLLLTTEEGVPFRRRPHRPQPLAYTMPSPIALTSPPRQESIFKKRSPSYLTAIRSAESYLMALSEADARSRSHDSTSTTSTPALSLSSSATTLSEDDVIKDAPYDNSDGLAYPVNPPTSEQVAANHLQFGFCANENYRYRSAHKPGTQVKQNHEQDPPYYILITTYLSYLIIICIGHIRDFFGKRFYPSSYRHLISFDVSYPALLFCSWPRVFFRLFISPDSKYLLTSLR